MIQAYNKEYVSDAMENLGEAFDYAVHAQNLNLNQFSSLFVMQMPQSLLKMEIRNM